MLTEKCLPFQLVLAHLTRSQSPGALRTSFHHRYPELTQWMLTMLYKYGEGPLWHLIGGAIPRSAAGDLPTLINQHKNFNLLTPATLYQYLPEPVYTAQFETFGQRVLHCLSEGLGDRVSQFRTPQVVATLVCMSTDATLIMKELCVDQSSVCVRGLAELPALVHSDIDTNAKQQKLIQDIRNGNLRFINHATVWTATLMGSYPHTQPVAISFGAEGETTSTVLADVRKLESYLSRCKYCVATGTDCCGFRCDDCMRSRALCRVCRTSGILHWHPWLRPCSCCLRIGQKCIRLLPALLSMDSGGSQLSAQLSLGSENETAHEHIPLGDEEAMAETLDQVMGLYFDVNPFGDGPHQVKCWLNAMRNPMLVEFEGEIWLISVLLIAELANNPNDELGHQLKLLLPTDVVMVKDRQNPKNASSLTQRAVLERIPLGRVCATLLPVRAWNDSKQYFKAPRLLCISGNCVVVADEKKIVLVRLRVASEVRELMEVPPKLQAMAFAPFASKNGRPNILLIASEKTLQAKRITSRQTKDLKVSQRDITRFVPVGSWRSDALLAVSK